MYQLTSAAVQKSSGRRKDLWIERSIHHVANQGSIGFGLFVSHNHTLNHYNSKNRGLLSWTIATTKNHWKKWAHTPQGFWQILKGCLIISGLNYMFNQIKTVKVRSTRPAKKIREHINPESCKKASTYSKMLPLCYICASTRVKHLTKIQDHSFADNYSYTGIKKLLDLQPSRM